MKNTGKNSIIILLIAATLAGAYFGAWRPFVKARKYIMALSKMGSIQSVEEFRRNFEEALQYRAPVSDDEIVKFIGSDIVGMISKGDQSEEVSRRLLAFIDEYVHPEDALHLLNMARSYHFIWMNYGYKEEDFRKAEEYYKKVLEIGPKLPPALYGMLDLYRVKKDAEKIREYGNRILELWPEDNRVVEALKLVK